MVTHLEPDILHCEVKWASNKASGGDEIPVQLFKKLKDDAVKVLHSTCQQIWKTQKVSFYSNLKAVPKNIPTTAQLHLFHMLARSCSKSSKLGFNSM